MSIRFGDLQVLGQRSQEAGKVAGQPERTREAAQAATQATGLHRAAQRLQQVNRGDGPQGSRIARDGTRREREPGRERGPKKRRDQQPPHDRQKSGPVGGACDRTGWESSGVGSRDHRTRGRYVDLQA